MTGNPFRPTFGASPLKWAGRNAVLDDFRAGLNGGVGNPNRAMLISGHRGMGKTVLLTELEDIAAQQGWVIIRVSGRSDSIKELVESTIPSKIQELTSPSTRRIKEIRIAGVGGIGTEETSVPPVPTLESKLRELSGHLHESGILITMDEVQDADPSDLERIAVAFQHLVRDEFTVAIVMAGLTAGVDQLLHLPGTTFLRRARRFRLGPVNSSATLAAFTDTSTLTHIHFDADAAVTASNASHGYPFLIQLIGYLAWKSAAAANHAVITTATVKDIIPEAVSMMGEQVHDPAVRALTPRQMDYLYALARVADNAGEALSRAVAEELESSTTSTSEVRARLLEQGLIDAPRHGTVALGLPYLREYLSSGGEQTLVD